LIFELIKNKKFDIPNIYEKCISPTFDTKSK
jgi:hypothetical protein